MTRLLILAISTAALLSACSPMRHQPYDDNDVTARARPNPASKAAAFMGYHGPVEREGEELPK